MAAFDWGYLHDLYKRMGLNMEGKFDDRVVRERFNMNDPGETFADSIGLSESEKRSLDEIFEHGRKFDKEFFKQARKHSKTAEFARRYGMHMGGNEGEATYFGHRMKNWTATKPIPKQKWFPKDVIDMSYINEVYVTTIVKYK